MYHSIILDGALPHLHSVLIIAGLGLVGIVIGSSVFNRYRDTFAEAV